MPSPPPHEPTDKDSEDFYELHTHETGTEHFPAATDTAMGTTSTVLVRDPETDTIYDIGSDWDTTADILTHIDEKFPDGEYELGVPAEVMDPTPGDCDLCDTTMEDGGACAPNKLIRYDDGTLLAALPYGTNAPGADEPCTDCNVAPGENHHPLCDKEICPQCGGQLFGCKCSTVAHVLPTRRPA